MKSLLTGLLLIAYDFSHGASCQAPGRSFIEGKLKTSFATDPAEKELKDIATDPKNYALREDLKSLNRRSMYANRIELVEIQASTNVKFSQMIGATRNTTEIPDFPIPGANSRLLGESDALAIEVNNVSKEELDVLPPHVLDKLSNKFKIKYMYPYDKYEYVLTYDGRELPMEKALAKMQNDFEDACEDRLRENQHTRDLHRLDRKSRGLDPIPVKSSPSKSGSSSQ